MSAGQRVCGRVQQMSVDADRCLPSKPRALCGVCARRLPEGTPAHRDRVTLDASAIELGAMGCRMWLGHEGPRGWGRPAYFFDVVAGDIQVREVRGVARAGQGESAGGAA